MYFEIIPSYIIVYICVALPTALVPACYWLGFRNMYKRSTDNYFHQESYLRDRMLTGSAYKLAYLDGIPDDEIKERKTKVTVSDSGKHVEVDEDKKECAPKPKKKRVKKVA